jgi:hypothetical protein
MKTKRKITFAILSLGVTTASAHAFENPHDVVVVENEFRISRDHIDICKQNIITSSQKKFVCIVKIAEGDVSDFVVRQDSADFLIRLPGARKVRTSFKATSIGYQVSIQIPYLHRYHMVRRADTFLNTAFLKADDTALKVVFYTAKR